MASHTTGPWEARDNGQTYAVIGPNAEIVASGQWHPLDGLRASKRTATPLQPANARLIAAAPELLAALVALEAAPDDDSRYNAAIDARAAIAKATK